MILEISKKAIIGLLIASAAFGLGRLSVLMGKKEPIAIEGYSPAQPAPPPAALPPVAGRASADTNSASYVASKNGKSYYFPWCGTVKRIKPENLIYFSSKAEAEKAGYSPGNCSGLK